MPLNTDSPAAADDVVPVDPAGAGKANDGTDRNDDEVMADGAWAAFRVVALGAATSSSDPSSPSSPPDEPLCRASSLVAPD